MSSIIIQTVMLREFLCVFNGNELVLGVLFSCWMLLTGLGAWLGRFGRNIKTQGVAIPALLLIAVAFAIASILVLNGYKNSVFIAGTMTGPAEMVICCALLLLPVCVVSGYLFTLFCRHLTTIQAGTVLARVYSYESAGSIVGGLLFNIVFVFFLDAMQCLLLLVVINACAGFYFLMLEKKKMIAVALVVVAAGFIALILHTGIYRKCLQKLYPQQDITYVKDTPYGKIVITETLHQHNFFENGTLLFSTNNIIEKEEAVHYALLQHHHPAKVLLISGGIGGMAEEVLKYKNAKVDYVELNPVLAALALRYNPTLADGRVNIITRDARMFIRETDNRYDAVLINLPEPSSAQLNRYYSKEFFAEVKGILNPGAVLSTGLPPSANYMNAAAKQLNSILFNTLKTTFANVIIVPGERNYFIASDSVCLYDFGQMAEHKGITNLYVNANYIDDVMLQQNAARLTKRLDLNAPVDTDFKPVLYFVDVQVWLSLFNSSFRLFFMVILAVCLGALIFLRPLSLGLFTTGYTSASSQLLLMMAFQVIYGFVYQAAGIMITVFFAGLAIGSSLAARRTSVSTAHYLWMQLLVGVYCIIIALALMFLHTGGIPALIVIMVLTLVSGLIAGMQFGLAAALQKDNLRLAAGNSYAADLAGSAIGALLTVCLLVPFLGILNSLYVLAAANIIVMAVMKLKFVKSERSQRLR